MSTNKSLLAKGRAEAIFKEGTLRSKEVREFLVKEHHLTKSHASNVCKSARKALGCWHGKTRGENRKERMPFVRPPKDGKKILEEFKTLEKVMKEDIKKE